MEAVILAAGLGTRLSPLTDDRPKCLVEVNGVSILETQLAALMASGTRRVTVVVGNRADQVRSRIGEKYAGMPVVYAESARFAATGTATSFLCGLGVVRDSFCLIEGDVVFEPSMLDRLARAMRTTPGRVHTALTPFLPPLEGSTVSLDRDGRVMDIRRGYAVGSAPKRFKSINLHAFDARFVPLLKSSLTAFLAEAPASVSLEEYFAHAIAQSLFELRSVDCSDLEWVEVDTLEDHALASARHWTGRLRSRDASPSLPDHPPLAAQRTVLCPGNEY